MVPAEIGNRPDRNASTAEPNAIGVISRATQRTPQRLMPAKNNTRPQAMSVMGTPGRYQAWMADADRMAVRPQVGIQPHQ